MLIKIHSKGTKITTTQEKKSLNMNDYAKFSDDNILLYENKILVHTVPIKNLSSIGSHKFGSWEIFNGYGNGTLQIYLHPPYYTLAISKWIQFNKTVSFDKYSKNDTAGLISMVLVLIIGTIVSLIGGVLQASPGFLVIILMFLIYSAHCLRFAVLNKKLHFQ